VSRISLRAGKSVLEGYRLKTFLGEGGFGHVWETEGPSGESLALKFIRSGSDLAAPHEVRNILNVRAIDHPHLIRVDRVWADRGYIVVVMELADGSLQEMLQICRRDYSTPILPDYVCYYLSQAADALDFLNATRHRVGGNIVGIQHCDIKPSNLLVLGEAVKVCDFGLASTLSSSEAPHRPAGTLAYAAPEIFRGLLSRWTDQFALAVTYCELRGGRRPFANIPLRFAADYVHPRPDLSMLPVDERSIVARALAPHPWERWKSCGEFMVHLNRVAGNKTA
jgi:serine/threonine protein kinase, bacterial